LRFAAAGVCAVLLLSGAVSSAQTLPPVYFDAPMIFGTGYAYSVAVGDFNGDGKLDLAVANGVGVSVLLGNGDGAFQPAVTYAAGTYTESIAVGDFNGDGKLDLVVTNNLSSGGTVSVLLGNGDGTFQAPRTYGVGASPYGVAVGDFNGDGKLDLVVTNSGSSGSVSVLLGNGDGTFQAAVNYNVGTYPYSVAVGDFNGDGKPDLVVTNYTSSTSDNSVSVLLGNGDGTFQPALNSAAGTDLISVAVGDFSGDGILDLALASYLSGKLTVLLGNGDGTFQPPVNYTVGKNSRLVVAGGFNGDGKLDLAVANAANLPGNTVSVLLGNGDGTFQAAVNYGVTFSSPVSVAVGDFNGDGKPDLAVALLDGTVTVLPGNGDGTFQAGVSYAVGGGLLSVAVGDFNRDGQPDLAMANQAGNSVAILLNTIADRNSQTITFSKIPNQSIGIPPFPISATASSGLSVSFTSTTLPVCTVSGGMVTLLKTGECSITASQAGDIYNAAATPVIQSFRVTSGTTPQTITFALPNQPFGAAPFTVSATASSGLTVGFASTTVTTCTVTGDTATLLAPGRCAIKASQPGSATYAAATPVTQSFTIEKVTQTIMFGALPNEPIDTAPFTVSATASSGLAVSFASTTATTCTVSGDTVTLVAAGRCAIKASQAGNADYDAATPVTQAFTVTKLAQTITFGPLAGQTLGAAPFPISATASSGLTVSFASTTTTVCTVSEDTVTLVAAGHCSIKATQAGNGTYAAAPAVVQVKP